MALIKRVLAKPQVDVLTVRFTIALVSLVLLIITLSYLFWIKADNPWSDIADEMADRVSRYQQSTNKQPTWPDSIDLQWLNQQTAITPFKNTYHLQYNLAELMSMPSDFIQALPIKLQLLMAKAGNHAAQFIYAETLQGQPRDYWLSQAKNNGSIAAKIAIAQDFYQQGQYAQALALTEKLHEISAKVVFIDSALALGLPAEKWLSKIEEKLKQQYQPTLTQFARYYRLSTDDALLSNQQATQQYTEALCQYPLYIYSYTGRDAEHYTQLFESIITANPALLDSFCVINFNWLDKQSLVTIATESVQWSGFHIVIDDQISRAFIRQNVLSLPRIDRASVSQQAIIRHELAHWLDFEDEYALSLAVGSLACQLGAKKYQVLGHNIVVVDTEISFMTSQQGIDFINQVMPWAQFIKHPLDWLKWDVKKQHYYLNIQPSSAENVTKVGLYQAETCSQFERVTSIKPHGFSSFMQQHIQSVPELYLKLI